MKGLSLRMYRWRTFSAAVLGALAAGCAVSSPGMGYIGGWDSNISNETGRWAGYQRGGDYETQVGLFLLNVPDRTNGPALVPGMEAQVPPGVFRGPTTVEGYTQSARAWPGVIDVIPAGTRLRATMLRAKGNFRARLLTRVYVKAQVLTGPHRGEIVDLEQVSNYRMDVETRRAALLGPNEDFLTEAR